ncbi:glycosyltransferase family 2 protein [Kineococcus sp. SYSU DK004]|uniref:glycosyltransferase n=1 Tax=Kineococcus sp. SYSU DK004 TaxID=3383125 RepID=UPI003D7E1A30
MSGPPGGERLRTAAVVPVRGHAALLDGALEALRAQTLPLDEVVVVDDDPQPSLRLPAPVRVVTSRGAGPYAARNLGVAATDADVVLFLDARSRPRPRWVERTVAAFADPGTGLVGSDTLVRGGSSLAERASEVQQFASLDKYVRAPFFLPYLPTCNLAVRREDFTAVGGFSTVRSGGDADLCWRVQRATGHRMAVVEEVLMEWVPRTRWRDLLEQNYRYGRSHHALRVDWSDRGLDVREPLPPWRLLARTAKAGLRYGAAVPRGADARAQRFVALAGSCFDWGYWSAHRAGRAASAHSERRPG